MGIRSLNRFLQNKCKNLLPIGLEKLKNKRIAIDANNYLYQIINGDLIKNVNDACDVFSKYNIEILWIFDGYPPEYKKKIIEKRRNYFTSLNNKHNILSQIKKSNMSTKLEKTMEIIETKMRKLTSNDISEVKKYLEKNNYKYFVTNNEVEADKMCVDLALNNTVDAVLSEDMDIIGMCNPLTIRCFNKNNETCIYYNLHQIVSELGIEINDFKKMCSIVSNTMTIEKAFEKVKNDKINS